MGLGVKQIQRGSEIALEWAKSIKRNPLKKDVLRTVTIAKDGATKSIGRDSEKAFIEVIKPGDYRKVIVRALDGNSAIKSVQYSDGSWLETTYIRNTKPRTNGEFVMFKKGGATAKIGYSTRGEFNPQKMKEHFMANLKRLGEPKFEVNIRELFGKTTSKIKRAVNRFIDTVSPFISRYNKTNRTMRRLASEFEKFN